MTAAALITVAIGIAAAWLLYHHDRQQTRAHTDRTGGTRD